MIVTSGRKCFELSRSQGPLGSWLKMCLESSAWNSDVTFLTWQPSILPSRSVWKLALILGPKSSANGSLAFILLRRILRLSDTPSSRLLFQLAPSMPNTGEAASGLWPTSQARDHKSGKGGPHGWGNSRPLNEVVLQSPGPGLWNTPKAADVASQGKHRGGGRRGKTKTDLANQAKLWPTPHTTCAKGTGEHGTGTENLQTAVNGQLNPVFVEWLMGFPEGWTDLKGSATRSSHKSRSRSSK